MSKLYETTRASLAGHTYHSHGDSQRLEYWGSKVDGEGVVYVSTVLVCPVSADNFLDRVQELSHQNDRIVPILVANMLICLLKIRESR